MRSGVNATVALEKARRVSLGMIATPGSGLRMTAINFRASLIRERLSVNGSPSGRAPRGWELRDQGQSRCPAGPAGSSPLSGDPDMVAAIRPLIGAGPVGVIAAALGRAVARRCRSCADAQPVRDQGIDLGITIDTVEYVAPGPGPARARSASLPGSLLYGGNQIRLVETLLHRGGERGPARGRVCLCRRHAAHRAKGGMATYRR